MVECSCQIDVDIDEFSELISRKVLKARVCHICSECGKVIAPGDEYLREVVRDDRPRAIKTCMVCKNIRDVLFCSYYYGMLMETLEEWIDDPGIPEACIAKLEPEARAVVCDLIEANWYRYDDDEDENDEYDT